MDKKDLGDLKREELVDLVYDLMNEDNKENRPTIEQVRAEKDKLAHKRRFRRMFVNTLAVLIVVAAVAVLISTLFMPVIQVSGDSMEPSMKDGDILLLVRSKDPDSGDVCCISWQNKMLLKRVIGLPGDKVDMDSEGNVYVNGSKLDEPYVQDLCLGECDVKFPVSFIPDDYYQNGEPGHPQYELTSQYKIVDGQHVNSIKRYKGSQVITTSAGSLSWAVSSSATGWILQIWTARLTAIPWPNPRLSNRGRWRIWSHRDMICRCSPAIIPARTDIQ